MAQTMCMVSVSVPPPVASTARWCIGGHAEADNSMSDQQTSHDAQGSVPPSRLPDTISKGGEE